MTPPQAAYKVLTADQMAALEAGFFAGAPVDREDGYIHLSTADQLTKTVDKHFVGQDELWVVAVDLTALGDAIKWEDVARRRGVPAPLRHPDAGNRDCLFATRPGGRRSGGAAGRRVKNRQ